MKNEQFWSLEFGVWSLEFEVPIIAGVRDELV